MTLARWGIQNAVTCFDIHMYLNAEILLQFCYVSVMANAEWLHIELRKTQINEYQNYQETNIKP